MDAVVESPPQPSTRAAPQAPSRTRSAAGRATRTSPVLAPWIHAQAVNVARHAAALRPFRRDEFGKGAAAPSDGHIQAANELIVSLRNELLKLTQHVSTAADAALNEPTTRHLRQLTSKKEHAHRWVHAVEQVWDFYFELFGQRQSQYGDWLLSCDRIALDCYQAAYTGLGAARSVPAPPPFCYIRTGFSPATFRRNIPLRRLGQQLNPFPLIQLPYTRLVNPWTLSAVLHEVSHNLQNDLGLAKAIPREIALRLLRAGAGRAVAATWTRWNRELFADVSAALLGGPAVVASLMDVVGRSTETALHYNPRGPHPTPYLRTFISIEVLRRMGFAEEAEHFKRAWKQVYPSPRAGTLPQKLLETFDEANRLVVDTVCFQPYPSLGDKSLAQVYHFTDRDQQMTEESARRLAAGVDPGIVPARYLVGAARFALDQRLARPGVIMENFYIELARR